MRRILIAAAALLAFAYLPATAADDCTTIQSGELYATDGTQLTTGYDKWGYNYQGRMFRGTYCSYLRADPPPAWCTPYINDQLIMKWNDAWLSNEDCIGDGKLDRASPYQGSGAWLTNHMKGTCVPENDKGRPKKRRWTYFVKIVAAPADANSVGGVWYTADGTEIGPAIWGSFAIVEEISNDPCADQHGNQYLSPYTPGFGAYKPKH
jgi:hypothetical protein